MDKKTYDKAYDKFIEVWGEESQIQMCIEEMSELTKELCKLIRYQKRPKSKENDKDIEEIKKHIIEETADVLNCTEQVKRIFGEKEVEKIREEKMKRTLERVEQPKYRNKK